MSERERVSDEQVWMMVEHVNARGRFSPRLAVADCLGWSLAEIDHALDRHHTVLHPPDPGPLSAGELEAVLDALDQYLVGAELSPSKLEVLARARGRLGEMLRSARSPAPEEPPDLLNALERAYRAGWNDHANRPSMSLEARDRAAPEVARRIVGTRRPAPAP